jgi:prepilin signal peptidase PulO-like enzyme (type II secretory pathway)
MSEPLLSYLLSFPPKMPEAIWLVPIIVLAILGWTALKDALTGRVPDILLALGFVGALGASLWGEGQSLATKRLIVAGVAFFVLVIINAFYFRLARRDAFGFGDVKWSGLAAFMFGLEILFWTWCVAAWLGVMWFIIRKVVGFLWPRFRGESYIHFVPFLFIGLIVSSFKDMLLKLL